MKALPIHRWARRVLPARWRARLVWRRLARAAWRAGEPELRWLPQLVRRDRAALDIGANWGIYTYWLRRWASPVLAFEPNPNLVAHLRALHCAGVEVFPYAASDRDGRTRLEVPLLDRFQLDGLGAIEPGPRFAAMATVQWEIETRRLDGLQLPPVGFIKIDVEGHEFEVIAGAEALLRRDRPAILFEAEERHQPGSLRRCRQLLEELGYSGFFLCGGRWQRLEQFHPETHQSPEAVGISERIAGKLYINNFLFLPDAESIRMIAPGAGAGAAGKHD